MVDHLFVFLFVVVYPSVGFGTFLRFRRALREGRGSRRRLYLRSLCGQWGLAAIAAGIWIYEGRPASDLGFRFDFGLGFWVGLAVAIAGFVFFSSMLRAVRSADDELRSAYEAAVGDRLGSLLPRDEAELRLFTLLGLTAGIVEELLWRGYLLWYLSRFMPTPAAVLVAFVVFAVGHGYQGVKGAMKAGALGGVLLGLYLLTGSLWVPMFLHASVDIIQGRIAAALLSSR